MVDNRNTDTSGVGKMAVGVMVAIGTVGFNAILGWLCVSTLSSTSKIASILDEQEHQTQVAGTLRERLDATISRLPGEFPPLEFKIQLQTLSNRLQIIEADFQALKLEMIGKASARNMSELNAAISDLASIEYVREAADSAAHRNIAPVFALFTQWERKLSNWETYYRGLVPDDIREEINKRVINKNE